MILPEPIDPKANRNAEFYGVTDANGVFSVSHTDSATSLGIDIKKEGYYRTRTVHELYVPEQLDDVTVKKSRHANLRLVLRKIGNPIAMYAKNLSVLSRLRLPEMGKPIGYDLMVGDWVGPYGKGVSTDIFFKEESYRKSSDQYSDVVTVNFPNPGDGIQVFELPEAQQGGEFRSPHKAPTTGYQSEYRRECSAGLGQAEKYEFDPHRIYLFRVRTVLNHDGQVVSAHYGKIYGDFMQFRYYLNPTPNDLNLEFDPSKNLIQHLRYDEGVSDP